MWNQDRARAHICICEPKHDPINLKINLDIYRKIENQPNLLYVQKAVCVISCRSLALFLSSKYDYVADAWFFPDYVTLKRIYNFVQNISFQEYNP